MEIGNGKKQNILMYFSFKHQLFIGEQFNQQLEPVCQLETISHLRDGYGTKKQMCSFLTSNIVVSRLKAGQVSTFSIRKSKHRRIGYLIETLLLRDSFIGACFWNSVEQGVSTTPGHHKVA